MMELHQVSVAYGARRVITDVDLHLPATGICALVGPSGCGKSSILMACNRLGELEPGFQRTGRITLRGQAIDQLSPHVLRQRVGLILQQPSPFPCSIRKNIELPLREHGIGSRSERRSLCEQSLRAVGLWQEVGDRLDQNALRLSGGQQQRLCLARALALKPDVLLLDEPCSALDPMAAAHVEALITELGREHCILLVTHNLAQARRLASHCAVCWQRDGQGYIVEQGPSAAIFTEPTTPETRAYVQGVVG